jgi:anaerobic selenocysteine-containing dehydrogenase
MPISIISNCVLYGQQTSSNLASKAVGIMNVKARGAGVGRCRSIFTPIASKADLFLQLRPGTDSALALGMVHTIIEEELCDHQFVKNWTVGFDELKERATQYPLSKVEKITHVPEKIRQTARLYATKTFCVVMLIDQMVDSIQTRNPLYAACDWNDILKIFDMFVPSVFKISSGRRL